MATEVIQRKIDDLAAKAGHRVEATETVRFGYDGQNYTIDLSDQNKVAFWAAIKPFVEAAAVVPTKGRKAATKTTDSATPSKGTKTKSDKATSDAIRAWAPRHGYTIGNRGRIPDEVREAWVADGSPDKEMVETTPLPTAVVTAEPAAEPAPPISAAEPVQEQPAENFVTAGA